MVDATRRRIVAAGSSLATINTALLKSVANADPQGLSIANFGARSDAGDQTVAVQRAYDTLAAQGGGTLVFPAGTYAIALKLTSRDVHLRGAGSGATRLMPARPDAAILTAFYRNGAQSAVYVSDLDLVGTGKFQSTLFLAGGQTYSKNAEFSGGTHFERVRFHNADKCIERRFGSIVLVVDQCTFTDANYHIYATSFDGSNGGVPMHAGCTSVSRSRLLGFRKAMFYVRSTVQGSGQITFSENIVENGSGFVFYIDGFVATRVPAIVIRDQWNENAADGMQLIVAGNRHERAMFLYARDCTSPIVVENTPLSSVCLEGSVLQTRDCDITDFTYTGDVASSVSHESAYAFSGTVQGICRTIAGPSLAQGLRTPWFAMALPVLRSPAYRAAVLQQFDASEQITFAGSRTVGTRSAADPVIGTAAQDVEMRGGERLSMPAFAVKRGRWLAISYAARIVAGGPVEIQLNGAQGMSGSGSISRSDWVRLVAIVEVTDDSGSQYLLHTTKAAATLRIGGLFVMEFDNRQQAVDYVNSGAFPT